MIYLDNAATSWPKPPEVLKAMTNVLEHAGGNPGRSAHRLAIAAARIIYDTREELADFFGASDPLNVVFTSSATHSINLATKGILKPGDHVVTSSMEHNAVLRPLRSLQEHGISLSIVPCAPDGSLDIEQIAMAVQPGTRLVAVAHGSNVTGTLAPIAEIAAICRKTGALLLVDAAQTAGAIPIDVSAMSIDLLAFTGHKDLLGPPGIGGLVIGEAGLASEIEPLIMGGTGSVSDSDEQPEDSPERFESGTANLVGIAGLGAGLKWIRERGMDNIRDHTIKLHRTLLEGLAAIRGVTTYGRLDPEHSVAIVSFTATGKQTSQIAFRLDQDYEILTRSGLHCAPAAHKTIGSFPGGTVRMAPGIFNTPGDMEEALRAIEQVVRS